MEKEYEKKYHSYESGNWWFAGRRNAILRLLEKENKASRILDVGCAGGALLMDLKARGFQNIFGIDYSAEAIETCKKRRLDNVFLMDAHYPTFDENYFDIIISSDSLEHLEKEDVALASWYKILKPGGKILVFVPAFMHLWSEFDVLNMHFRRYTKTTLRNALIRNGFVGSRTSYWNFVLYIPVLIYRSISNLFEKSSSVNNAFGDLHSKTPGFINAIFKFWISKIENPLFVGLGFPWGVSVFAKATKG